MYRVGNPDAHEINGNVRLTTPGMGFRVMSDSGLIKKFCET